MKLSTQLPTSLGLVPNPGRRGYQPISEASTPTKGEPPAQVFALTDEIAPDGTTPRSCGLQPLDSPDTRVMGDAGSALGAASSHPQSRVRRLREAIVEAYARVAEDDDLPRLSSALAGAALVGTGVGLAAR